MICWLFGATPYGNIVDGMLLYNFAADLGWSCYWKSRENPASNLAVRHTDEHIPWYSSPIRIRLPALDPHRRRLLCDKIHAAAIAIHVAGEQIRPLGKVMRWTALR
jgi:hypothetical protein